MGQANRQRDEGGADRLHDPGGELTANSFVMQSLSVTVTRLLGWGLLLASGAVVVLLGGLWLEHRVGATLPVPTGPFAVGRTGFVWDDRLTVWIWYPADAPTVADDYLPADIRGAMQRQRPAVINFLTSDLAKVRSYSARDVPVSTRERAYPVVIFRGGGQGAALNYQSLTQDLASHGFIVVGLDTRGGGNPENCDGRQDEEGCATAMMTPLLTDIGRTIDHLGQLNHDDARFAGRLDLTRIGLFGHSFGGAQSAQFCAQDARCRAGIDIDGRPLGDVIRRGIRVPFMFLMADHEADNDPVSRRILGQLQAIYDQQPPSTRVRADIRGAHHFTFSDDGAVLKSPVLRLLLRVRAGLRIAGPRQLAVTAYAVHTFFNHHLKKASTAPLKLPSPEYPELLIR